MIKKEGELDVWALICQAAQLPSSEKKRHVAKIPIPLLKPTKGQTELYTWRLVCINCLERLFTYEPGKGVPWGGDGEICHTA